MYLGFEQDFIDKEKKNKYADMDKKELIEKYLEILWYANRALYPHQLIEMKDMIEKIEKHITSKMINDLKDLSDKDIIIKYGLKPQSISKRYYNVEPEKIKSINKTDVLKRKENFEKQYARYEERYGFKYRYGKKSKI